jgi:uncharacterized protein (TIGR02246 family)
MTDDERAIRAQVATCLEASKAGDTAKVLSLMTDDVVFLLPGHLMRKADFAAAAQAQSGAGAPQIDGASDIQEIKVFGDWAFLWSKLRVVVTPAQGKPVTRAGHTLTILAKQNGRWLLARDANLLVPVDRE